MIAAFLCMVVAVHDGDSLRCADRTRVRLAGIEANELTGGCHLPRCAPMPAQQARRTLASMTIGRRLTCTPVDTSYRRVVARCSVDGVDVSCALIAAGAAVRWDSYWRRYRMAPCRRGG